MSYYFAITLPCGILLLADNRRRIHGEVGKDPFKDAILLDDAKKLRRLDDFFWATGVGLSHFHSTAMDEIRKTFSVGEGGRRVSLKSLPDVADIKGTVSRCYQKALSESVEAAKSLGGCPVDPREVYCDILLAVLTQDGLPLLIECSMDRDFDPRLAVGPGHFCFPSLPGLRSSTLEGKVRWALEYVSDQLSGVPAMSVSEKALKALPPILAVVADALPREVSSCGDLVMVDSRGFKWFLF